MSLKVKEDYTTEEHQEAANIARRRTDEPEIETGDSAIFSQLDRDLSKDVADMSAERYLVLEDEIFVEVDVNAANE